MSKRQRWTPVSGSESRIYEPRERALVAALDLPLRLVRSVRFFAGGPAAGPPKLEELRDVLVLRLDRIGDVVMSLPALQDLRRALPEARLRLAVGRWSEPIARSAPVDEVIVWSAPWVGRPSEGVDSLAALLGRARALRSARPDLALDLQGDVRANLLLWQSGARHRVGYANTGGGALLTQAVPLDETCDWPEQNRRAVREALGLVGDGTPASWPELLAAGERAAAATLLAELGGTLGRPLVGLHPSGGRTIKQWPVSRWAEVAGRLVRECGATIVLTGAAGDAALTGELKRALGDRAHDLAGRLDVRQTLALIGELDLFLSPDTGPMHMACAVDTPSLSVFGPSDPRRYFSGGDPSGPGARHLVIAPELWCAPCNLIRHPPDECATAVVPECLDRVHAEPVYAAARELLKRTGAG